jgi:hypothetical protein
MGLDVMQIEGLTRSAARAAEEAFMALNLVAKCLEDTGSDLADEAMKIRNQARSLEDMVSRELIVVQELGAHGRGRR